MVFFYRVNNLQNILILRRSEYGFEFNLKFIYISPKFVRIFEQMKTLTVFRVFTDMLSNSPKRSPRCSPGFEGTENMFYFLKTNIGGKSEIPLYSQS